MKATKREREVQVCDPATDPSILVELASSTPSAYANPNFPKEHLQRGACHYPWFVEENPSLGLLYLEDLSFRVRLLDDLAYGWREQGVPALSRQLAAQLAADCVEHVLPLFEIKNGDYQLLLDALSLGQQTGCASQGTREALLEAMVKSSYLCNLPTPSRWIANAVYQFVDFLGPDSNSVSVINCLVYSMNSVFYASDHLYFPLEMYAKENGWPVDLEKEWQTNRIKHYYYKNAKETKCK